MLRPSLNSDSTAPVSYTHLNSGGGYKLRVDLTAPNLALNKPSTAWDSDEPWYLPEYGNDGDLGTRWAGYYGTNWWWVDLGSPMTFNQVKINWEAAYALSLIHI